MPKMTVYNQLGEKAGEMKLSDAVFGVEPKESVVHQVYVAMMANLRQPWADTKNKGEVRGGGKKPWAQKGTGRARHGSSRSPIWRGGGITFGPLTVRNYKQKINQKMKKLATKMCLSDKVNNERMLILESMPQDGKTKTMAVLYNKLVNKGKVALLVTEENEKQAVQASRNLPKLEICRVKDLNIVDLLHHQYILITKKAVESLEKRLNV
jgi:large subunit ribosomal protein L4